MDSLQIKALVAGFFFGLWPLIMSKTGLNGNVSSVIYAACASLMLLPFSRGSWGNMQDIKWELVFLSAAFGASGLLCFNKMIAESKPTNISTLFVLMIVSQILVPALYQVILTRGITLNQGIGFTLAIAAGIFLNKK